MIIGNIGHTSQYENIHPLFVKAFNYIRTIDFSTIQCEEIEISGKDLFVSISQSTLRSKEQAKPEVHNKYIDIQLPISKPETFGWKHRSKLNKALAPFNDEKDIQFYGDEPDTYFEVTPGNFVIFFPDDAHAPCIGEGNILKIVIKIKV